MMRAESTFAPGWEGKQNNFKFRMLLSFSDFLRFWPCFLKQKDPKYGNFHLF
jgi:hypothetical protein